MTQSEYKPKEPTVSEPKSAYQKPSLVELGDLRTLTQSGRSGAKEGSSGSTPGMMS